ncbi:UDP-glucose--hexose-1-phosphate uridylyltransferase [Staphylococcus simulans]|uniref:UDP-glucose--hexose-1-phosphate uridylyltransferase n=1 Tax=Staphylococcus simulans TaxID=1286 RepID=UPI0021CF5B5F|nr:UDP-glucose--hexose-1-phosphate uridylyltransferase [Staphylococcus simulans]UXV38190.1 UDP-glucose--hexose-1-phosphate uridylyltransferase [Staphylococcus simulans]UXV40638.1 UDP-glucose--hexose-1-phosphate uridylyltransferase [Staphylococcus simulans]
MKLNQQLIQRFISYAVEYGDFEKEDAFYIQNLVLEITQAEDIEHEERDISELDTPNAIAQHWINRMIEHHLIEDAVYQKEMVETKLLDLITPKPSTINRNFRQLYQDSPEKATQYLYDICMRNHYIKADAIAQNIHFYTPTNYGDLEITINMSKPEKDAKEIAAAREAKQTSYPLCALCMENEGYQGSVTQAARRNHRIALIKLDGEDWGFQFSPYAYFPEHSIVLSAQHVPMKIGRQTFVNLLDFVKQFPHYFAGSNADLPIVGGSILSHNHYQTGRHTFPMDNATETERFTIDDYPEVEAVLLDWPMSVIRLKGNNQAQLIDAAEHIFNQWNAYSDESVQVKAQSEAGERHHTITPIARYRQETGRFELDLVLRDNQTSEDYPDGIFHPHQDVQHIKKENIGLIEVMGTAILPARLKHELKQVEQYVLGETDIDLGVHQDFADELKAKHQFTPENAEGIVLDAVGQKFKRVLEDAGVFKRDTEGLEAFKRFVQTL